MDYSVRTMIGAAMLGAALLAAGCDGKKQGDTPSTTGGRTDSASIAGTRDSTVGAPAAGEVKTFSFHATPLGIDSGSGSVSLKHEKVPGFTEEQSGSYTVADPAILRRLKVGVETHVTLRVAGDRALITSVEQEHEPGHEH